MASSLNGNSRQLILETVVEAGKPVRMSQIIEAIQNKRPGASSIDIRNMVSIMIASGDLKMTPELQIELSGELQLAD